MRPFFKYLKYCFTSKYRHGYGIHSPYVYHLVTTIMEEELPYYKYSLIENVRSKMAQVGEKLGYTEADGSKKLYSVGRLVKKYSIKPKYGQLLFRLVNYYKPTSVVECGSTCGISTMYLAAPDSKTPVFALTTQNEMADLAKSFQDRVEMKNVRHFKVEDLAAGYAELIERLPARDFLFVNTAEPCEVEKIVKRRFDKDGRQFFIVLPNPYASEQMWELWQQLKTDDRVKVSIDIFSYALLIADVELQKGDYVLRF